MSYRLTDYVESPKFADADWLSGDWRERASRSLLWLPLLLGGIALTIAVSQAGLIRRFVGSRFGSLRDARSCADEKDGTAPWRAARLRDAIVGNDKYAVAAVLGPPRSLRGAPTREDYLQADTWYYPIDAAARLAIAIEFSNNVAREAHLLNVRL